MFPFKKKKDDILDLTKEPLFNDEPAPILEKTDENISTKLDLIISQLKNIENRLNIIESKLQQPQEKQESQW